MTSALLHVEQLGVDFPVGGGWFRSRRLQALAGLSFSLHRGEVVSVVGESGSGKSTLAKAVTRLVEPTAGQILLDGVDVLARSVRRTYRSRVQMVFQDPFGSLNPAHRVLHHVARPLLLHGKATTQDVEAKAMALLELAGLSPADRYLRAYPHALSGGQRQRVAIARALAPEPDLLVADEPTSMLDVSIRMDVLRLLQRLVDDRGLALLLITHDLAAARYLSDRVLVLYAGRLMEDAPAKSIGSTPRHPYTRLLVEAAPRPGADILAPLPARSGLPPNIEPPPGCPFAERCLEVHDRCRRELPALHVQPDGHRVACHLYETEKE